MLLGRKRPTKKTELTDNKGGLYHCIVDYAHLGNGTGHRIATMTGPLLLTSGLVKYEEGLYSNLFNICVCVCGGGVCSVLSELFRYLQSFRKAFV